MADMVSAKRRAATKMTAPARSITPDATAPASSAAIAADTMKGSIMNETIKQITDRAQTDGKAAFEKGKATLTDFAAFQQGNVEAMIESTRIAGKGLETMAQQSAAYAKASFDKSAAIAKSLTAVKSPTEFFTLQGDYVRTALDDFVAEASRSTEAALKLAGEVARPIQNRVALATDKMKVAA